MRYQKVDERETATEQGVTLFRVAYVDPHYYVEMYDVDCDDVENVIAWAKGFLDSAGFEKGTSYYIAIRSSPHEGSLDTEQGVGLTWLTPYPEGL